MNHVVSNRVVLGVKYDGKAINGFTFATQPELFTKIFAAETTEGDAAAALKDGKLLVGKTIATIVDGMWVRRSRPRPRTSW